MYFSRRRHYSHDIWPGFVDVIATVLMVLIFVLMTFVIAQLYLTDAISDRDHNLALLHEQIEKLKRNNKALTEKNISLESSEQSLKQMLEELKAMLSQFKDEKEKLLETNQKLETHNQSIAQDLAQLKELLEALKKKEEEDVAEIGKLQSLLDQKKKEKKGIGHYRSEFFAKLQKVLGNRSDIRVVGDRFVFQSEVLFDKASAELDAEGAKNLERLATALKEISDQIPKEINWVLRVDGHTDQLPIHTSKFPSNWELSSARAISVVKYLIEKGIEPRHLVAAGFGEHQPLQDDGKDDQKGGDKGRNRRIEFKLDQR